MLPNCTIDLHFSDSNVKHFLCFWHKNRNIDQWNIIESPEIIHACTYGQSIYHKGKDTMEKRQCLQ